MSRYIKVSEFKLFDTVDRKFVDITELPKPVHVNVLDCYWSYGDCQTYETRSLFGDVKAVYNRVNKVEIGVVSIEVLSYTKFRVTVGDFVADLDYHFENYHDCFEKEDFKQIVYDTSLVIAGNTTSSSDWSPGATVSVVLERLHGLRYGIIPPSEFKLGGGAFNDVDAYSDEYSSIGLCEFKTNIAVLLKMLSSVHNVFLLGAYAILFDDDYNFAALASVWDINAKSNYILISKVLYSVNSTFDAEVRKVYDDDNRKWRELAEADTGDELVPDE